MLYDAILDSLTTQGLELCYTPIIIINFLQFSDERLIHVVIFVVHVTGIVALLTNRMSTF